MSDDTQQERHHDAEAEVPGGPGSTWAAAWEGPDGGPDDLDAVEDLSGFPDLSYRDFRWRR